MKLIAIFMITVACLMFTGTTNAQTEDKKFDKLAAEFLKGYFHASPISATNIGVHDYDNLLDDASPAAAEKEIKRLEYYKEKLTKINKSNLSKAKNIDCRILEENIDEGLFGLKDLKEPEWNPMVYTGAIGNSIASLIYQEFAPLEKRLKNATERAKAVPAFLKQAKMSLKNSTKLHVETAINQNQGNIGLFKDELPAAGKNASPKIQQAITSSSKIAIAALEEFGKWLKEDLLPRATMDTRLGKVMFDKKLTFALKSNLTPDQVLKRAEEEKVHVHDMMYTLAVPLYKEYYPADSTTPGKLELIKKVLAKIVLEHPKKEEVMDVIKRMMPQISQFVTDKNLLTLDPTQPLVIRETPEYERGVSVASLESPGPLEKNLKSFYNVTPIPDDWTPEQVESYLREYNTWSLCDLSIHEGIPGHYVQLYYANRYPSVIRSVYGSGSMVEGWAVYAERMMIDQGFMNNDPKMKLINLKWYIRAVLNAIIDQKIHAYGMTQQEMMDLLTKEGFQEEREAAGKWRRANLTSAQLSTYFVGFQEIWDLRDAYKKKMGDKYTLKNFHETFLSYGSPSVKYIREMLLGE